MPQALHDGNVTAYGLEGLATVVVFAYRECGASLTLRETGAAQDDRCYPRARHSTGSLWHGRFPELLPEFLTIDEDVPHIAPPLALEY
jgi:hypothetical protein